MGSSESTFGHPRLDVSIDEIQCDVLVASFDSAVLRSSGVRLVAHLWAHDLSAELAIDTRSPEELWNHYREEKHRYAKTLQRNCRLGRLIATSVGSSLFVTKAVHRENLSYVSSRSIAKKTRTCGRPTYSPTSVQRSVTVTAVKLQHIPHAPTCIGPLPRPPIPLSRGSLRTRATFSY